LVSIFAHHSIELKSLKLYLKLVKVDLLRGLVFDSYIKLSKVYYDLILIVILRDFELFFMLNLSKLVHKLVKTVFLIFSQTGRTKPSQGQLSNFALLLTNQLFSVLFFLLLLLMISDNLLNTLLTRLN
jgi:hypothetical protein